MGRKVWLVTAALVLWHTPASRADDSDEPGRGVARISVINGDVSVRRGDSGDWVAAAPNAPLVVQDNVLTGQNSRAEVQFDYANFVRLTSNTELRLSELENRRYQMQVARGTVTFRVLRDSEADVEVSTPAVSVRPRKKGAYRISVRDNGETEVTVRSGEVEVYTPKGVERLRSGRTMVARATASDTEFQMASEIPEDDFDRWNVQRDRDLGRTNSYRYVHRDIYGAEDLDPYGGWVNVDTYGWVWRPHVHVDWAPYRHGRWAWVDWYGWTWVSYDPWGWAPYHYGRWFHHGHHGWLWYPGGHHRRHYWSPALVAFFGVGSVRVGIGFGNVGWVPLAPYEPYYRWYGRGYYGGYRGGGRYVDRSVNIVNNVNVTNIYRNSRVRNGVTAIDGGDFARGRTRNLMHVSSDDIRNARLVRGQLPVAPDRESTRFADREARVDARAISRGGNGGERFYSRREPARVERVSFDEQRQGIERMSRRDGPGRESAVSGRTQERAEPARRADAQIASRPAENGAGGRQPSAENRSWRRFGDPAARTEERSRGEAPARRDSTQGWRTFGAPASRENGAAAPRPNASSGRDASRGWRSQGESPGAAPATVRGNDGNEGGRTSRRDTSGSWQRFSEPRTSPDNSSASQPGAAQPQRERSNDWRRFSEAPATRSEPRSDAGVERSRPSRDEGSGAARRERSFDSQNSIRLSPPVIRERSSGSERFQRSESRGAGSASRGGGASMQSAPRSSGGGSFGGGSGRTSSGGGGRTSTSGGGGGGRSSGESGGGGGGGGRGSRR